MGCVLRSSMTQKAASRAAPASTLTSTIGEVQPSEEAAISPYVRPVSARLIVAAPAASSGGGGPGARDSGTCRAAMTTTAAASGRLMKKTSRQDTALISQPPRNGPIAVAT